MKKNVVGILMIMTVLFSFLMVTGSSVYAECGDVALGQAISADCYSAEKNGDVHTINNKIYNLVQILAGLVFGVSVLVIVYAGFKYATSQGEAKVTEGAKMQIISAGIGIGIALLAFVILNVFVTAFG